MEQSSSVRVQFDMAHMIRRVLAQLIDMLIVGILGFVAAFVMVFILARVGVIYSEGPAIGMSLFVFGVVVLLYFTLTESGGKTPGKSMVGIQVVDENGEPPGLERSLVRNLLRFIDLLPFYYMGGFISIALTARQQRLGDLAAGTFVVRTVRFIRICTLCYFENYHALVACTECGGPLNRAPTLEKLEAYSHRTAAISPGAAVTEEAADQVPVRLSVEHPDRVSRAFLFYSWVSAIPLYIGMFFYTMGAGAVTFVALGAILFTGRYPARLFEFQREYLTSVFRIYAYFPFFLTDRWSPDHITYSGSRAQELHPLLLDADPPERLSRLVLVFLKLPSTILGLVSGAVGLAFLLLFVLTIPAWLAILVTGRYPRRLFTLNASLLEWIARVITWQNFMRDDRSLFGTTKPVLFATVLTMVGVVIYNVAYAAPLPTADFSVLPVFGSAPRFVQFNDQSTGLLNTESSPFPELTPFSLGISQALPLLSAAAAWEWDLDGDGKVDSRERHAEYAYDSVGTYRVSLKVTGPLGSDRTEREITVGAPVEAIDVSTGNGHTCAVTTAGGVMCWGQGGNGQLGDGTKSGRDSPVEVIGLGSGVTNVSAGSGRTCALTTKGDVWCWGQIGASVQTTPEKVKGLSSVVAISTWGSHTCAVTAAGSVNCWGSNPSGLGDGTTTSSATPVEVAGLTSGVLAVSVGGDGHHTCALLTAGGVKCWGGNEFGQLGNGTTTQSTTPVDVKGLSTGVVAMSAGLEHACALTAAGGVKCWGENRNGQLGDGTNVDHSSPVDVVGLTSDVVAISAGSHHTCALTTEGGVKCWGSNGYGQLGDGTATGGNTPAGRNIPVDVAGLTSGVTAVSVGWPHACALTKGGGLMCWGGNQNGGLGDGTTTARTAGAVIGFRAYGPSTGPELVQPTLAPTPRPRRAAAAVVATPAPVHIPTPTTVPLPPTPTALPPTPAPPPGPTSATLVSVGFDYTCAITEAGGVRCWENRNTPVDVVGLTGAVASVSVGRRSACVVEVEGGLKCWGSPNQSDHPAQ